MRIPLFSLLLAFTLIAVGCADETEPAEPEVGTELGAEGAQGMEEAGPAAVATLQPTEGNNVSGTVSFYDAGQGVRVVADLTGLSEGMHGFHIHETGDCSAPDASSAGGHFAPEGSPHGAPTDPPSERHTGDLGNIEAGGMGEATYERVDEVISLEGPNSIIGKAVIVHGGEDDLESQPSGDAGPRLACGVIQAHGAEMMGGEGEM